MNTHLLRPAEVSRREFIRNMALGSAALAAGALVGCGTPGGRTRKGPTALVQSLNPGWLFGGEFTEGSLQPGFDDGQFAKIGLPHSVVTQSWQNWDPARWESVWVYRRHFLVPPEFQGRRVFLDFAGVMAGATPVINGHALPQHLGGYLPFHYEITDWLEAGDNVLAVAVDSRWSQIPPDGNAKGPSSVDFSEVGGIYRGVRLRAVPQIFISDVFAKPVNVLDPARRVEVSGTLDAAVAPPGPVRVQVDLMDGGRRVASASTTVQLAQPGETAWNLTLSNLGEIKLWDVDSPQLYDVITTLFVAEKPWHDYRTRIGFREARFELDGFYLNGRRLQLFGLCRHEIYPYVGFAMPGRVMRRDAEILRHELNCNSVRCSHYPQSEAFLEACDELGLLVWEELPGWGYIGDTAWQDLAVQEVQDMVMRDRNHPSIFLWGVRVNESKNNPAFYERTTAALKALDDSRPASGAMVGGLHSTKDWAEDVFAFNDYNHNKKTGDVELLPPLPGVPYLLTEAVGQIVGVGPGTDHIYRRAAEPVLQEKQAVYHAEAHDQAAANKRYAGVIAWCAFEYASPVKVAWRGVKYPGVCDVFRLPKLGASFYQAQIAPQIRPVIQPNFYWDFGPRSPRGPGKGALIFSNCERLEVFIDGRSQAMLEPDRARFPHLRYAPFAVDLDLDGSGHPELRLDGYVGGQMVLSRSFSAKPADDQWIMTADDMELTGDGADATRVVLRVTDKFGAPRAFAMGEITFELSGPGQMVGDNPFSLDDCGGAGAVWVRTLPESSGKILLKGTHSGFGEKMVTISVRA